MQESDLIFDENDPFVHSRDLTESDREAKTRFGQNYSAEVAHVTDTGCMRGSHSRERGNLSAGGNACHCPQV